MHCASDRNPSPAGQVTASDTEEESEQEAERLSVVVFCFSYVKSSTDLSVWREDVRGSSFLSLGTAVVDVQ